MHHGIATAIASDFLNRNPDPPTLAFLKKARETPKKARVFSLRGTPNPWKRQEKRPNKQGKSESEKTKETKKAGNGGSGKAKSQGISTARSKFGHFSPQNASPPQPYRYRREIATYSPERIAAYSLTA